MKAADLRDKNPEELAEIRKSLAHDAFQNRLKNFTNRLDDTSTIRKGKRDLARVLTILRQRDAAPVATVTAPAAAAPAEPAKKKTKTKVEAAPTGTAAAPATKKASSKKGEAKSQ
jgi:large subunit ribosomal protein L29